MRTGPPPGPTRNWLRGAGEPSALPADTGSRPGLTIRNLVKAYRGVPAVSGIDLEVGAGEVLGLLGPNGAGKTTTIECVAGLTPPDQGEIRIGGVDARASADEAKRKLGVVLQTTGLHDDITPREAIEAFGALYRGVVPAGPLLERFGLVRKAAARVSSLSGGERQRLALALAFVDDPQVVLLDEPTAGLDPAMRRAVHDLVREMKADGRAILLATHDLEEAAQLCDRIAVIDHGRIVAQGSPADLMARMGGAMRVEAQANGALAAEWFVGNQAFQSVRCEGSSVQLVTQRLNSAVSELTAILGAHGLELVSLTAGQGRLEDVVLALVSDHTLG